MGFISYIGRISVRKKILHILQLLISIIIIDCTFEKTMTTDINPKTTFIEFEKLPSGTPCQLIDGEIFMTPSPAFIHQKILGELYFLIKESLKLKNIGTVILSPMDVYLSEEEVYQPDLIFVSNENSDIIKENIKGVPDIVVEILSPSSAYHDLVHKKNTYEEQGVKEFWVLDPEEKSFEIYENQSQKFILISKAKAKGMVTSKILSDLKLQLETIFTL